jgi:hypothetical protein
MKHKFLRLHSSIFRQNIEEKNSFQDQKKAAYNEKPKKQAHNLSIRTRSGDVAEKARENKKE